MRKLKLFVWEDVLTDYTSGMVCVLAYSLEEAFELLYQKDDIAWSHLQGIWDAMSWDSEVIEKLKIKHPKEVLTALPKRHLGKQVSPTALKPKVVEKPEAFVVHGGG